MAETSRLFFALWPDASVRQSLGALQRGLPENLGRRTHGADLHITLVFLGQVDDDRRPCVEQAAGAIRGRPFELNIDRLEHWRGPRVLWCGPSHKPQALDGLVRDLQIGLQACHFEPEQRPYAPHVTLARKARAVGARNLDEPIPWPVRDFVLVASRPQVGPPRYEVVGRWGLADG